MPIPCHLEINISLRKPEYWHIPSCTSWLQWQVVILIVPIRGDVVDIERSDKLGRGDLDDAGCSCA